MGAPQFMPSSYRRYGVDADANRHVDLWNDWRDIFASIANLLKQNGWQTDAPVLAEAQLAPRRRGAGATAHAGSDRRRSTASRPRASPPTATCPATRRRC